MSVQDDEPLRRRCSVTPDASRARTFTRRRARQTVFVVAGAASRTPKSKRLDRMPSAPRNHSGPRPDDGKIWTHELRSSRTRSTRPDLLDVTMASAGVRAAPSRFCSARGERTTVQLRFGFNPFRSKESCFETR
jgi:hypothetical protein